MSVRPSFAISNALFSFPTTRSLSRESLSIFSPNHIPFSLFTFSSYVPKHNLKLVPFSILPELDDCEGCHLSNYLYSIVRDALHLHYPRHALLDGVPMRGSLEATSDHIIASDVPPAPSPVLFPSLLNLSLPRLPLKTSTRCHPTPCQRFPSYFASHLQSFIPSHPIDTIDSFHSYSILAFDSLGSRTHI